MKKLLTFLLAFVILMSFAACAAEPAQTAPVAETVPETMAPSLLEVEITLDNWQDYFELREAQRLILTSTGEIYNREFGQGVFLKPEYVQVLAEADVSFDLFADQVRYQVYGDITTDNFVIREDTLHIEGQQTMTETVQDFRLDEKIAAGTDMHNAVAAWFTLSEEFGC
ncbi:MAG: hypothetical protein IJE81_02870 [Oscillospiraceae bacterium]|nr:hypothetical protein [Oscillospiraceae bacterium]